MVFARPTTYYVHLVLEYLYEEREEEKILQQFAMLYVAPFGDTWGIIVLLCWRFLLAARELHCVQFVPWLFDYLPRIY